MKALTLCLFSLCLLLSNQAQAQTVKGTNVRYVTYSANGQHGAGVFEQTADKSWIEYKKAKGRRAHADFTETGRDEWSVYLRKSDGARIQLDLYRKKVRLNGSDFYNISQVSIKAPGKQQAVQNGTVVVYSDANYRGKFQALNEGAHRMNALSRVGNDRISSIKIKSGYKVIAYQHDNFQGASRTYTSSISFTSNFNDQISSIKVVRNTTTPTPPPPPPAANATYRVEIDACHSDLSNEGTGGRITVAFFAGNQRVKGIFRDGVAENCLSADAKFSFTTNKPITHIVVSTNSGDAFYIDEIRLFKNNSLKQHHGRDNGSGWCLSTDANDANGSWKGRIANGCKSSQRFNY